MDWKRGKPMLLPPAPQPRKECYPYKIQIITLPIIAVHPHPVGVYKVWMKSFDFIPQYLGISWGEIKDDNIPDI
ncbi:MAG: hypothetical protein AB1606_07525 [Nitrospirota bacterium]